MYKTQHESKKSLVIGTLFSLISFFCLSTANAMVKIIDGRINSLQILFLRSIAGLGGFFFVFISVQFLTVANATLLLNTGPFFIPFILFLCFKEPIDHRLWAGIIPGFIGTAIILNPGSNIFQWHAFLPLISGLCVAVVLISLRRLHYHKEPMLRILMYLFLFAAIFTLPLALLNWTNPSLKDCLLLALIAITSFLSQTTITLGLRYASPKALAPLCYTSVIFAILFDWLIWKDVPTWTSAIGIVIVIMGGIIALHIENKSYKSA